MPAADFSKIIRDLSTIGEAVEIKVSHHDLWNKYPLPSGYGVRLCAV
jgi:hypothetical protein